ncbi:TPA: hypothetical protein EYP13_03725, partial [Candidatus Micrarchaeota archaeon]|nr:hypothetical protein [Candidatus Micrarchaeota archaeon]
MAILPSADFVLSAIAYASGLSLLCLGLTLTYMTTKVPNFAHATIAITGSIVTLLLIDRVYYPMATWSIYIVAPIIAFMVGAALSTAIYVVVLRPLADRGNTVIGLMIATFALDIILVSLLTVLVYQLPAENLGRLTAQNLLGFERRITILGITGTSSAYVLPVMAFLTALALYVFLNKTKFGIAMRAAIENPDLASVLGINVRRVYLASWLIAGGIAGMAGSLMAFRIAKVE